MYFLLKDTLQFSSNIVIKFELPLFISRKLLYEKKTLYIYFFVLEFKF